jgi:hypothetical protein
LTKDRGRLDAKAAYRREIIQSFPLVGRS